MSTIKYALETQAAKYNGLDEETEGGFSKKKTTHTSANWNQRCRIGMLLNRIIFKL